MVALTRFAFVASLAALVAAQAPFSITKPGAQNWWVAKSANELKWTCETSPSQTFTVLVSNDNLSLFPLPLAVISIQQNAACSITVTQNQVNQAPGTGYHILLADPFNSTHIYATSEAFEIKPLGSAYPATTTPGASATGSGAANPSGSPNSQNSGAFSSIKGFGFSVGAVVAASMAYLM